jgi:lysozyme
MPISPAGLAFLTRLEGSRSQVYRDVAGLPTIGVGHLLTLAERQTQTLSIAGAWVDVTPGLSAAQIAALLQQDLEPVCACLDALGVALTPPQHDALCSFIFNVGRGAFAGSTLRRQLLAGRFDAVPGELRRWTRAGGQVVQGLVNRREAEIRVWEDAHYG